LVAAVHAGVHLAARQQCVAAERLQKTVRTIPTRWQL
jgi:hypothetical protein